MFHFFSWKCRSAVLICWQKSLLFCSTSLLNAKIQSLSPNLFLFTWCSAVVNIYQRKSERLHLFKKFVKLKLPVINDTPKIHLRSLGSVNFIDAWQVHKFFVKLMENCQKQVCKYKFTTRISCSVPRGNKHCWNKHTSIPNQLMK